MGSVKFITFGRYYFVLKKVGGSIAVGVAVKELTTLKFTNAQTNLIVKAFKTAPIVKVSQTTLNTILIGTVNFAKEFIDFVDSVNFSKSSNSDENSQYPDPKHNRNCSKHSSCKHHPMNLWV